MKLSKRSKYGLLALMDLTARQDQSPVRLKELAKRSNIPPKFLEQIFLTLRNSGIVHSQIGAGGGYTLGRPAKYVMLGEVIRILDGTIAPVSCISKIAYEPCTCPNERTCPLRTVMIQVRTAIVGVIDNTSLADAVAHKKLRQSHKQFASPPQHRRHAQKHKNQLKEYRSEKQIASSPR